MVLCLQVLCAQLDECVEKLESLLSAHIREQRRLCRALPADKIRVRWCSFRDRITDGHFKRMFRMSVACFNAFCTVLSANIGEDVFRSESYLDDQASERSTPLMPGEIKVALSLRMLAGGSYLDLVPLFAVSTTGLYKIFKAFTQWVLASFDFPLVTWIRTGNWDALHQLALQFAESSNGVFMGPFGAIDGTAVKIKCPTFTEVPDPGNYFCRKGFCALNVQAMCDRLKRFIWCFPSNKGSTHDSSAFANSQLCDLLNEEHVLMELLLRGLFIAADSAYVLAPHMICPCDVTEITGPCKESRDAFNFYLSSCRIHIECAFGELVMRWGIFWRTMRFGLRKSIDIVNVAMLVHNFIVDYRQGNTTEDSDMFNTFNHDAEDTLQQELTRTTGEIPQANVTDNNEPRPTGRRSKDEEASRQEGLKIREQLTVKLALASCPPDYVSSCALSYGLILSFAAAAPPHKREPSMLGREMTADLPLCPTTQ